MASVKPPPLFDNIGVWKMAEHVIWNLITAIRWEAVNPSDEDFLNMLETDLDYELSRLQN